MSLLSSIQIKMKGKWLHCNKPQHNRGLPSCQSLAVQNKPEQLKGKAHLESKEVEVFLYHKSTMIPSLSSKKGEKKNHHPPIHWVIVLFLNRKRKKNVSLDICLPCRKTEAAVRDVLTQPLLFRGARAVSPSLVWVRQTQEIFTQG